MEDRVHFVLGCSGLDPVRQNYLKRIQSLLTSLDKKIADMIMTDQKLLMQLLMDSSNIEELNSLKVDDSIYKEIESVSRDMCFALHRKRIQLLNINL